MSNQNLQDAAKALDQKSTTPDIMKVHCAVNHIGEGSNNVLCRIKELGTNSPSMKIPLSAFGEDAPIKGENFLAEIDNNLVFQSGQYLQGGNAKIISRDGGGMQEFDMHSYMASLVEESDVETAENTETNIPF